MAALYRSFACTPHKFEMTCEIDTLESAKLLEVVGDQQVRIEVKRGKKVCSTVWKKATHTGVIDFSQLVKQNSTLYEKSNKSWDPKHYEFNLITVSPSHGKRILSTASFNLGAIAKLKEKVVLYVALDMTNGRAPGKLKLAIECKHKGGGLANDKKLPSSRVSDAASDTDFVVTTKPKVPLAALGTVTENVDDEKEPAPVKPAAAPAPVVLVAPVASKVERAPVDEPSAKKVKAEPEPELEVAAPSTPPPPLPALDFLGSGLLGPSRPTFVQPAPVVPEASSPEPAPAAAPAAAPAPTLSASKAAPAPPTRKIVINPAAKSAPGKVTIPPASKAVSATPKPTKPAVGGRGLPVVPVLAALFGGLALKTMMADPTKRKTMMADPTKRKCKVEHDVHSTDTLTHVAQLHGLTPDEIIKRKENRNVRLQGWLHGSSKNTKEQVREGKTIYIGERLCIR